MDLHQRFLRIRRILEELEACIVVKSLPVTGITTAPRGSQNFVPFENGDFWATQNEWTDFSFTLTVPEDFTGKVMLYAVTGREQEWEAVNPQFEVIVDGQMQQAFDTKHTRLLLQPEAAPGQSYAVLLRGYAMLAKKNQTPPVLTLSLCDVSPQVEALMYDIKVPWEAVNMLADGERDREIVLRALCDAVNLLDLRQKHSQAFYASLEQARAFLKTNLYDYYAQDPPVAIASCVGHTHIDVAWLWDIEQTRYKAVRSFSTVLNYMKQFEEYMFMSSQPVLYQFVQEDAPEVFENIKQRIIEGRWEAEGGMWVEADCNLASGESLVRQFLHGKEYFRKNFNKNSEILWLPDVFGYSAALPQIMNLSGIKYFMTSKLSWSEFNLYPYDSFYWEGIDGTQILTHFTPARDFASVNQFDLAHFTTYNAMLGPNQLKGGWQRFQQKGLDNSFIVSYGFGDGGGGPTEWMLENGRRMATPLPGIPVAVQQHPSQFFKKLEQNLAHHPDTPTWCGELYLEYHRGTYTAVAKNKRNNRKIELALREIELWASYAAALKNFDYPAKELHNIWEQMLTLQFHDILPGSSIKKVYEDSDKTYADLFNRLNKMKDTVFACLSHSLKGDLAVYNSMAYRRDDLVTFTGPKGIAALIDDQGNRYPAQKDGRGYVAYLQNLSPMGASTFTFVYGEQEQHPGLTLSPQDFDTPFYSGSFDQSMRITSLVDKRTGRQLCKAGEVLNRIVCYENKPHNYDAWDINIYYNQHHWDVDEVTDVELISQGPVLSRLRTTYTYMNSTITQDMVFYSNSPRIDFETHVNWQEVQYMLKAEFPVDVFYHEATYDIQYGNVKRPTHQNTSWDVARFEVCAHKWADVSEGNYGVSLLNDCKYGYAIDNKKMTLTLLKSSTEPDPVADIGDHTFTYSLYPHVGTWQEGDTIKQGYQLNIPTTALLLKDPGEGQLLPLFEVTTPGVMVEAVKEQLDGTAMVLRLYESFGQREEQVVIHTGLPIKQAAVCNLMEEEITPADFSKNQITLSLKPYEIKSFLVTFDT